MMTMFGSRRAHYLVRVRIFLITVALIAGLVGCNGTSKYSLTMAIAPDRSGTATDLTNASPYAAGSEVSIKAAANPGYWFVNWMAPAGKFANANAPQTNFTMPAQDITVTANFEPSEFHEGNGTAEDPYQIADWHQLDYARNYLDSYFVLVNNLDSTTLGYRELAGLTADEGKGWRPIGITAEPFTGHFDGQGYEISDLFINHPEENNVGLFGSIGEGGFITNISVVNASVLGYDDVGVVAGWNDGTMSNCYATGNISGHWDVGGLVGKNYEGHVTDSYSNGKVSGHSAVGGLVGINFDIVRNSHSSANVTGTTVGGLVGVNWYNGTVSNSYSTGNVTGDESVYGYGEYVGGLVAGNNGDITSCYSTSTVTGDRSVGGLVAVNTHTVNNSYSTGRVTGDEYFGGLVGWNEKGTVNNSFWDTETSGRSFSAGGTGKTTAQIKDIDTFSKVGWNIVAVTLNQTNPAYIWNIVDDVTYPFLSWQPV